jgi:hypothetical protein
MAEPSEQKPVETPVASPTPAPDAPVPAVPEQVAPAPAAEPAGAAPAPEVTPTPEAPAEPTLLEKFDTEKAEADKAKEKPAEPTKPAEPEIKSEEPKKEGEPEAKAAEPAKPDPVAYEYALPDTLKMDEATKGELHTALDSFRADPAKGAQGLIDLHNKVMTAYDTSLREQIRNDQVKAFNDMRKDWRTKVMADEQIGGAGHQTSMGAIARMRDLFVAEEDRAEFESFLKYTGAGDNPYFLRMLHNAARYFDEPGMPEPNAQPTKDAGRPQNRRATLYDNPRSPGNRQ